MRIKNIISIFLLFLLLQGQLFSQEKNPVVDSLQVLFKKATHDTVRCALLNQMIEAENDDKVWPAYNEQLKAICDKNIKSNGPYTDTFLSYMAQANGNDAFLQLQEGKVAEALKSYQANLAIQQKIGDKGGMGSTYYAIGVIYQNQGDTPGALECYFKSLKIQEEIKDRKNMAYTLNIIGIMYKEQGNYTKALNSYFKSLKIREEVKHKKGVAQSLNNIGGVFMELHNTQKAFYYFEKSLKMQEEVNDKIGMAYSLSNIGRIYEFQNDNEKALGAYNKAYTILEEIENKEGMSNSLYNIAALLFKTGKTKEALVLAEKCLQLSQKLGYPDKINAPSNLLSKIYFKNGDYRKAYEMQVLYKQMDDSINNVANRKAFAQKTFQYAYEKKAVQDSLRSAEEKKVSALQLKQEKTKSYMLYGGLALTLLFGIFMFNRFRVTQKQKKIIEDQKIVVEEKQKEVMDSIRYAKRIQDSLLPTDRYIDKVLSENKTKKKDS